MMSGRMLCWVYDRVANGGGVNDPVMSNLSPVTPVEAEKR